MKDEVFEKVLRNVGRVLEDTKVAEHEAQCERCRYELIKMEADRTGWELALEADPNAVLAQTLGPEGLRRAREIMTAVPPDSSDDPLVALKTYRERIAAGMERFQAAMEALREWLSIESMPLLELAAQVMRGEAEDDDSFILAQELPIDQASIPDDASYQTLIMLRLERQDLALLYENLGVTRPLHISPEFTRKDIELNELHLILILTPGILEIDPDEQVFGPDRFLEILLRAAEQDARLLVFRVRVN